MFLLTSWTYTEVSLWSCSYDSWIYSCLCNQCLSPPKDMSLNPFDGYVYSIQHYMIKFVSGLQQVAFFLRVLRFLHQLNWPPRYSWNIVDSGVKHHNPNLSTNKKMSYQYKHQSWKYSIFMNKLEKKKG